MRFLLLLLIATGGGCSLRSRYAMSDPVYAAKYTDGAERGDLLGKAKQALDARHTQGLSGGYAGGGVQVLPANGHTTVGGEIGWAGYAHSWLTCRAALAGYVGDDGGFVGGDVGMRAQTPTRLAPFVGIGTFHGLSSRSELANNDRIDNDDDDSIDEYDERKSRIDGWMSAVYPEVGAHFWINGDWRLTGYGRYMITTEGREFDDWLIGVQVAGFSR